MNTQLIKLRQRHPEFTYQSYHYQWQENSLNINWRFQLNNQIIFTPTLTINNLPSNILQKLNKNILDKFIFSLGMVELLSYWKASCSPTIVIKAGYLDNNQITWWHDLLIKGLGEFFYTNKIDFTPDDFVKFKIQQPQAHNPQPSSLPPITQNTSLTTILPIGGGKDSLVTAKILLDELDLNINIWTLNPIPAVVKSAQKLNLPLHTAYRTIGPNLLNLNRQGYLNGHTPFSAYLAFFYQLVAYITNGQYIVLSNESSANECNTIYKGHEINHQYSKSFEFEQKFRQYVQKYLTLSESQPKYFSFLRPLNELQIAKIFSAKCTNFFPFFRSCNRGQKTNTWCHECPKCLFVFLMLSPFLDEKILTSQIFNHNLFDQENLLETALKLIISDKDKPFECVGSKEESLIAFYLSIKKYHQKNLNLPFILQYIQNQILPQEKNLPQRAESVLRNWNEQHHLPEKFIKLLRQNLDVITYKTQISAHIIENLNQNQLCIFGLSREGWSTYRFIRHFLPNKQITLIDQKNLDQLDRKFQQAIFRDENIKFSQQLPNNNKSQLLFLSPGIPPKKYRQLQTSYTQLASNTQLFFKIIKNLPAADRPLIIGVTGTKGKSTTASAIYHVLSSNGLPALLGGNIGTPPLDLLQKVPFFGSQSNLNQKKPIYILELSSHQLANLKHSPNIAVVQEITPEHLDYYPDFDNYLTAKSHIAKYQQSQDLILFPENSATARKIATQGHAKQITFTQQTLTKLIEPQKLLIKGEHNLTNLAPAIIIGLKLGLTNQQITTALESFQPLDHRLQLVATIDGVEYYNDSLATTPKATIAAIDSFPNQPIILIAGGFDRGLNQKTLADKVSQANIKKLILLPDTGKQIAQFIKSTNIAFDIDIVEDLQQAVINAKSIAKTGDVVLLSPGAASFNMFKNYAQRGEEFIRLVKIPF